MDTLTTAVTPSIDYPKLPPLKAVKSGENYYLCTFKNKWLNGRAVAVKGSTKTAGVIVKQQKTGKIKWKEYFLVEHPQLRNFTAFRLEDEGNELRKKSYTIKFEPRESDAEDDEEEQEMISIKEAFKIQRLKAGATWALSQIIEGTPLDTALSDVFGRYSRDRKLLSLAMFMYLSKSAVMEDYSDFSKRYKLPYPKPLDGGQCSRLLSSIGDDDIQRFLQRLNAEALRLEDKSRKGTANVYYALDSSSISTYGKKVQQKIEFGYNKDGDDLKQINVMMLVNQHTGIPIFYREYAGSVPDISTVSTFVKDYARLQLNRNAIVVADRGYGSAPNVHRFFQTNTSFLLNFKTSYSFCKNLIKEHCAKLKAPMNIDEDGKNYVYSTQILWSYPVNYRTNCKIRTPHEKKPLHVHMFYDPQIRLQAELRFDAAVAKVVDKLNRGLKLDDEEERMRVKYIDPAPGDKKTKQYEINCIKRAEFLINKGIQILISDTVSDAAEARRAYDMRNSVELAFAMLKQQVGGRRLHASTEDTMRGKIFTLFMATSIGLMLRCRRHNNRSEGKVIDKSLSDHQILSELDNIECIQWEQGLYYNEITGKRRKILEELGLPLPEKEVFSQQEDPDAEEAPEDISTEESYRNDIREILKG